ncbi:hypothetical protein [Cysteiniphilum halobium]|uniref:hypothetical protein n=1 Tax=Cysteiniphilum halobium TaxID=2219059 RepID=UPI003F83516A
MFKQSQYDVIDIPVPVKGMNQNVSPELLPITQSYWLENILPTPLGQGQVRYGCKPLSGITLPADVKIQEMFYFYHFANTSDPQEQLLLYVQDNMNNNASIYLYNLSTQQFNPTPLKENLAVNTVPRSILFQERLLICNGVDHLMAWDGEILDEVHDFVAENTSTITKDWPYGFSCTVSGNRTFAPEKYFNGQQIQLMIDNQLHTLTLVQSTYNETTQTLSLTTLEILPNFTANMRLFYKDYPPRFSYLHVHKDRIYALSEGAVNQGYRQQPLYLYFTYRELSFNNWFDETTKQTPYIDLSYTHEQHDQLEAIQSLNNQLVIMGRRKTQIWQGTYPLDKSQFTWKSTLSTGIIHGNLLVTVGKKLFFVSPNGLQVLGAQDALTSGTSGIVASTQAQIATVEALNPLVRQYIKSLDSASYQCCDAFRYEDGGLIGFKIGNNETLIGLTNMQDTSWSVFSGFFKQSKSFCALHQQLYLAKDNQVYLYADGIKSHSDVIFNDDGQAIHFHWSLPMVQHKNKRFTCQRYEVMMSNPDITTTLSNTYQLKIYGDMPKAFELTANYPIDSGSTHNLPVIPSIDDGIQINRPYAAFKARLKFIALTFWGHLSGSVIDGQVIIKSIKFLGRKER